MGGDPLRRPAFLAAIDEVETRIRQNRARLARQHRSAALAALREDLDQLKELWENIWDLDRKRALLDTLIEKVIVRLRAAAKWGYPLLWAVDGFRAYPKAILKVFRDPLYTGRVGRPRLVVWDDLLHRPRRRR